VGCFGSWEGWQQSWGHGGYAGLLKWWLWVTEMEACAASNARAEPKQGREAVRGL